MYMLAEQVCSLELAVKLKELKIEQKSLFYWDSFWNCSNEKSYVVKFFPFSIVGKEKYSAFTAYELFSLLPAFIEIKEKEPFNFFNLCLKKKTADNIQYIIFYKCDSTIIKDGEFLECNIIEKHYDNNLANCLAKTLISLIQKSYLNK